MALSAFVLRAPPASAMARQKLGSIGGGPAIYARPVTLGNAGLCILGFPGLQFGKI